MITAEAQYRAWMLAGLSGDRAAYSRLLSHLSGHLRAYFARRVGTDAAEDLVQETLIAIHTRRATYDPSLPFTAWVLGIARYKQIDAWRRDRRRIQVALEDAGVFAEDTAGAAGARRDVEKLLARLPVQKRDLVRAVRLEGQSIAEQAKATGLSETVVKVTVHRAVKSLGQALGGGGEN